MTTPTPGPNQRCPKCDRTPEQYEQDVLLCGSDWHIWHAVSAAPQRLVSREPLAEALQPFQGDTEK